jgi:hypothetical protein
MRLEEEKRLRMGRIIIIIRKIQGVSWVKMGRKFIE